MGRSGDYSQLINNTGVVYNSSATNFTDPRTINVTASGNIVQWTNGTTAPASDVVANTAEINGKLYENNSPTPSLLTDVATLSAVPVFLGSVFNTVGITDNGNASAASASGFDSNSPTYPTGNSLSSNALHVMNGTVNWHGQSFVLGASGVNDVDSLGGTGINLPAGQFSNMLILGASINNNASYQAQFTVGYTDGTQTSFTQTLSDWTGGPGGPGTTGSNESIAATMTYYNSAINGTQNASRYLYGYNFSINPTKTVSYLLVSNNNNLKVLAIDLVKQTVGSAPAVGDSSFETPSYGTGGYDYNPTGTAWTFSGSSGIFGNGNSFTNGASAPDGTQVALLQSQGSFSQSITFATAGSYQLSFDAAQRAASSNYNLAGEDFEVEVDNTVVARLKPTATSYQLYTSEAFSVSSGSHTITFLGLDSAGGDNSALIDAVSIAVAASPSAPTPGDNGFEAVSVGNSYAYNPSGSPWTFSPQGNNTGSGLSGNGSAFTSGNPAAPQGSQVAFLQSTGTISQTVTGWNSGTYEISFQAAQRGNNGTSNENFEVLIDGYIVDAFTPSGTAYQSYTTRLFTVAAGSHTITLQGLDSAGGDNTVFLDSVSVTVAPTLANAVAESPLTSASAEPAPGQFWIAQNFDGGGRTVSHAVPIPKGPEHLVQPLNLRIGYPNQSRKKLVNSDAIGLIRLV